MEFMSSDAQMEVDDKISSARYRCPLSSRGSSVSSSKATRVLTGYGVRRSPVFRGANRWKSTIAISYRDVTTAA